MVTRIDIIRKEFISKVANLLYSLSYDFKAEIRNLGDLKVGIGDLDKAAGLETNYMNKLGLNEKEHLIEKGKILEKKDKIDVEKTKEATTVATRSFMNKLGAEKKTAYTQKTIAKVLHKVFVAIRTEVAKQEGMKELVKAIDEDAIASEELLTQIKREFDSLSTNTSLSFRQVKQALRGVKRQISELMNFTRKTEALEGQINRFLSGDISQHIALLENLESVGALEASTAPPPPPPPAGGGGTPINSFEDLINLGATPSIGGTT